MPNITAVSQPAPLAAGKLPAPLLAQLLRDLPTTDPQLLLGPAVGEDAAIIDWGADPPMLLVAKSDPITFATDEIGHYAVNVCANDLAVTGATPRFYLPTILLPDGLADVEMATRIFQQIGAACRTLNIVVVGGHSEITPAVNQPVIAGTLLGQVARDRYVRTGGCQPGDAVLLVGGVPVEGASIIAREKREDLLAQGWTIAELDEAAHYLYQPGISVLPPALLAAHAGLVTAMHDPTEGGIVTGLRELALAAQVGLEINLDAIPVPDLARRLCAEYGLDPLGTIASGALLATASQGNVSGLCALWQEQGYPCANIGRILPQTAGLVAIHGDSVVDFPHFDVDEITKIFAEPDPVYNSSL